MTLEQQIRALFDVIMEYTDGPDADRVMGRVMKDIRDDMVHEDPDRRDELVLQRLTGLLYDGLTFGNWPWNRASVGAPVVSRWLRDKDR